jgi:hypothetical protein
MVVSSGRAARRRADSKNFADLDVTCLSLGEVHCDQWAGLVFCLWRVSNEPRMGERLGVEIKAAIKETMLPLGGRGFIVPNGESLLGSASHAAVPRLHSFRFG